jgi:hypothetical protein
VLRRADDLTGPAENFLAARADLLDRLASEMVGPV